MPTYFNEIKSFSPANFVASILGHEGEGSLLTDLKRDKLAESLSSGGHRQGENSLLFGISVKLTDEGLLHYTQVVERCFQAKRTVEQVKSVLLI